MSIELQSSVTPQTKASPVVAARPTLSESGRERLADVSESATANTRETLAKVDAKNARPPAERQLDQLAKKAASAMFKGREVEVQGFLHGDSGRFVYRISDKSSGEVLAQTPPDALLRFYASYEGVPQPLVSVDA